MGIPAIYIRFDDRAALEAEFEKNLRFGGMFVENFRGIAVDDVCEVVLVHPDNKAELRLSCSVVWLSDAPSASGVGIALTDFTPDVRENIEEFIAAKKTSVPPDMMRNRSPKERLRGLSVAEQIKVAQRGSPQERMALERMYGKIVWEPILRNNRVTIPEVARIANMGALPQHLFELIGANAAWLRVPQIRRALLGNTKTPSHVVEKVLRLTPRRELRLVAKQSTYSRAIRDKARRLLMAN
jgi:Tfp pilus assembly protein PilZ